VPSTGAFVASALRDRRSGSATAIQRFGGGLNLNVHYHTLLFDGVFFARTEESCIVKMQDG
jgi:hypothetical protein